VGKEIDGNGDDEMGTRESIGWWFLMGGGA